MKNVLTFLTVAMFAVATQALQINWGSGVLYQINPDGTLSSSKMNANTARGNGYVFLLSQEEYNALNVADIINNYLDFESGIPTLKGGVTASATGASNKSGIISINTDVAQIPETKYYAAVVYTFIDSEGQVWANANKGITTINTLGLVEATTSTNLGTTGGFGATGWTKYEAVPEPTTVALLAFGLAAVGLKRKRA